MKHAIDSWRMHSLHQGTPSLYPFLFIDIHPPSFLHSNSNKVVKKKIDGEWEYHVIHWKTDTIKSMYERCCLQYPIVANCKVKYFAKFIPWYVRNKPNYSGLCWKHDLGIFFSTLLKTRRTQWHLDCECDCTFCIDCDHGKNPDEGQCHYGTCKRCMDSECPIEYTEDEQGKKGNSIKMDLKLTSIPFFTPRNMA